MKRVILVVVAVMLLGVTTVSAKGEKICVDHKGKTISVSVNAVPAFVAQGSSIGCDADQQAAFDDFLLLSPSNGDIIDAAINIDALTLSYLEELAALEKDYEEVGADSADEEGEEDGEE